MEPVLVNVALDKLWFGVSDFEEGGENRVQAQ